MTDDVLGARLRALIVQWREEAIDADRARDSGDNIEWDAGKAIRQCADEASALLLVRESPSTPIPLNAEQEHAAKEWAADDRLWTTQETVEFNLRTFARKILSARESPPQHPSIEYLIDRLENHYAFECEGGPLRNCVEWAAIVALLSTYRTRPELWSKTVSERPPTGWQLIETAPKDEVVDFWIVPRAPEESYRNSSGAPIVVTFKPYRHTGKLKSWSACAKATHWSRPLPAPPLSPESARPTDAATSVAGPSDNPV